MSNSRIKQRRDNPRGCARVTKNAADLAVELSKTTGTVVNSKVRKVAEMTLEEIEADYRRQNAIDLQGILDVMKELDVDFDQAETIYDRRRGV